DTLLDCGSIKRLQGARQLQDARRQDALDRLSAASPKDLQTATLHLRRIEPYLAGLERSPESRTLRRYLAAYRFHEATYGNGFIGLLPNYHKSRTSKLGEDVLKIVQRLVVTKFADPRNLSRLGVYGEIEL